MKSNSFTNANHVFNGWATASTASVGDYMDTALYLMGTEDVTLYVIWEPGTPGLSY